MVLGDAVVPLKFTHALQVVPDSFESAIAALALTLASVTAPAAISAVVMQSSGSPPALMPVMVPEPAIEIGMI